MIAHSQGVHLVLPRTFFPGDTAMMVPKTPDGRVIFIIPWHGHAIVGTTDTPIPDATLEPVPRADEVKFLLDMSAEYLSKAPKIEDVLSVFTGIRPFARLPARDAGLGRCVFILGGMRHGANMACAAGWLKPGAQHIATCCPGEIE